MRLQGVKVNKQSPVLSPFTTPGDVLTVSGSGRRNPRADVPPEDANGIAMLNINVLGDHVVVCNGQVWYDGNVPLWCFHAAATDAYVCEQPFGLICEGTAIDRSHVWSWSDDGTVLFRRRPSETALSGVLSSSIAVLLIAIAEGSTPVPAWLAIDAAMWTVGVSAAGGAGYAGMVLSGITLGVVIATRHQSPQLASVSLALSAAVALSTSIPAAQVGIKPAELIAVVAGAAATLAAGARGALWALPWAYHVTFHPIVLQSAAVDARDWWAVPSVSLLLTLSVALLGLSVAAPSDQSWYMYIRAARSQPVRQNGDPVADPSRSSVVPGGRRAATVDLAFF